MTNIKVVEKDSGKPGKNVAILCGVHGNEKGGVKAVDKAIEEIEPIAGKITFIYANLEAIKQNVRCVEYNLNRAFFKDQPDEVKDTLEGKTAKEIIPYLEKIDFMLDLHASYTPGSTPFIICREESFELAKVLPFEIVSTNWDGTHPGSTDYYMNFLNKMAVAVECGFLEDEESKDIADLAIKNFLIKAGIIEGESKENPNQRFYRVKNIYKNKGNFKITREFDDFEELKEKTIIGNDDETPVYREAGEVVIFVRSRDIPNDECFVTAEKISNN